MADSATFEILYQEYCPRVFALCRRLLRSHESAEDATQETFTRAYKTFRLYQPNKPFWHWIATIAHHYCIDQLRLQGRWQTIDMTLETNVDKLVCPQPLTEELFSAAQTQAHLNQAIDNLPGKYRVPFILAYQVHLSYDDIGSLLEVNRSHVGVLLLRAKQRLRLCLSQSGLGDLS